MACTPAMCDDETLLAWGATQGDILTGGGRLNELMHAGRDFRDPDDTPHFHKYSGTAHVQFEDWIRKGRRSPLVAGAWSRPLFLGGWAHDTDAETEVFNVQTPSLFVDLRFPRRRPDYSRRKGFGALSLDELRSLAQQHCFAGYSLIEPGLPPVCTRHHAIDWNYHPRFLRPRPNRWRIELPPGTTYPPGALGTPESALPHVLATGAASKGGSGSRASAGAGAASGASAGAAPGAAAGGGTPSEKKPVSALERARRADAKKRAAPVKVAQAFKEWGVALDEHKQAVYMERWKRFPDSDGPFLGLFRKRDPSASGHVDAIMCIAGDHFAYARDREVTPPIPSCDKGGCANLVNAAHKVADRLSMVAMLNLEGSYGRVSGGPAGAAPWTVVKSTLPWRERKPLALIARGGASIEYTDGHPVSVTFGSRGGTWTVLENTFSRVELERLLNIGGVAARSRL